MVKLILNHKLIFAARIRSTIEGSVFTLIHRGRRYSCSMVHQSRVPGQSWGYHSQDQQIGSLSLWPGPAHDQHQIRSNSCPKEGLGQGYPLPTPARTRTRLPFPTPSPPLPRSWDQNRAPLPKKFTPRAVMQNDFLFSYLAVN